MRPCQAAMSSRECQLGWYSAVSTRCPLRSYMRWTGGFSLAEKPSSIVSGWPHSSPSSRQPSMAHSPASRHTASARAGSDRKMSPPWRAGGTLPDMPLSMAATAG
jgi:hypothetical protein